MLVLTRKQNEQVVIQLGEQQVVVRVVELASGRVRLGFTAPTKVTVHREEVWNSLEQWRGAEAERLLAHPRLPVTNAKKEKQ